MVFTVPVCTNLFLLFVLIVDSIMLAHNNNTHIHICICRAATEGRGVDKVLELVGSPSALDLAVELVRPGGTISSCGCHTETGLKVVKLYDKNLTLKSGRCPARHYMDRLLPLVRSNKYDLTAIITHRLPLCAESYDIFDKKRDGCIKVVMDPRK